MHRQLSFIFIEGTKCNQRVLSHLVTTTHWACKLHLWWSTIWAPQAVTCMIAVHPVFVISVNFCGCAPPFFCKTWLLQIDAVQNPFQSLEWILGSRRVQMLCAKVHHSICYARQHSSEHAPQRRLAGSRITWDKTIKSNAFWRQTSVSLLKWWDQCGCESGSTWKWELQHGLAKNLWIWFWCTDCTRVSICFSCVLINCSKHCNHEEIKRGRLIGTPSNPDSRLENAFRQRNFQEESRAGDILNSQTSKNTLELFEFQFLHLYARESTNHTM